MLLMVFVCTALSVISIGLAIIHYQAWLGSYQQLEKEKAQMWETTQGGV